MWTLRRLGCFHWKQKQLNTGYVETEMNSKQQSGSSWKLNWRCNQDENSRNKDTLVDGEKYLGSGENRWHLLYCMLYIQVIILPQYVYFMEN